MYQFSGYDFPFHVSFGTHKDDFPIHSHNFTELTIITNGHAIHMVEDLEYTMLKGEVYIIKPAFVHGIKEVHELQQYNFIFDLEKLMLLDNELKRLPGFQSLFLREIEMRFITDFTSRVVLDTDQLNYVLSLCQKIEEEFLSRKDGFRIIIKSYLLSLICFISRQVTQPSKHNIDQMNKLEQSISYIEANYSNKITLKSLAKISFLSERQYSRLFKEIYHLSPIEYVIHCRLHHACDLIKKTSLTLTEIASLSGFYDKVSFTKHFKDKFNMTPGQYRNINNNSNEK